MNAEMIWLGGRELADESSCRGPIEVGARSVG